MTDFSFQWYAIGVLMGIFATLTLMDIAAEEQLKKFPKIVWVLMVIALLAILVIVYLLIKFSVAS